MFKLKGTILDPPRDEPRFDLHVPPQERPEQMEPHNLHQQQQQTLQHLQIHVQ